MATREEQRRAEHELAEARKLTPGKLLRLLGKSVLCAIVVSIIIIALGMMGVTAFKNFYLQLGLMMGVYLLAYPFITSEFRPKRRKEKASR